MAEVVAQTAEQVQQAQLESLPIEVELVALQLELVQVEMPLLQVHHHCLLLTFLVNRHHYHPAQYHQVMDHAVDVHQS